MMAEFVSRMMAERKVSGKPGVKISKAGDEEKEIKVEGNEF